MTLAKINLQCILSGGLEKKIDFPLKNAFWSNKFKTKSKTL